VYAVSFLALMYAAPVFAAEVLATAQADLADTALLHCTVNPAPIERPPPLGLQMQIRLPAQLMASRMQDTPGLKSLRCSGSQNPQSGATGTAP
jgi:hypothetical protein